ncbi:hypothetical protein FMM58_03795 [Campylobacter sp. LR291e]|uniref:helix-turn-helix domain-containing protein n=1 Tax=Campylobacter sp. LR291e TaxID=2593546 RepID=UPI00123BAFF7|nr:helix-turn-helix domain-containing protein [Campylobacter sp. LR291e]KAA6231209.1 hypothetical protein FMM58_03795 [Campylobacter sp. LR291e]
MIFKEKYEDNFSIIPNEIIKNNELSAMARIVAIYLLSLPKNWKVKLNYIAKELNISYNTCNKYIKELVANEILEKIQLKDNEGKFVDEFIYSIKINNQKDLKDIIQDELEKIEFKELKKYSEENELDKDESPKNNNSSRLTNLPSTDNLSTNNKENLKKEKLYALRGFDKILLFNLNSILTKKPKTIKNEELEIKGLNDNELKAYNAFIAYRKERGKLTKSTIKAINDKIFKLKLGGYDLEKIINKSIERGYLGLFEDKALFKGVKQNNKSPLALHKEILKEIYKINPDFSIKDRNNINFKINGKSVKHDGRFFTLI